MKTSALRLWLCTTRETASQGILSRIGLNECKRFLLTFVAHATVSECSMQLGDERYDTVYRTITCVSAITCVPAISCVSAYRLCSICCCIANWLTKRNDYTRNSHLCKYYGRGLRTVYFLLLRGLYGYSRFEASFVSEGSWWRTRAPTWMPCPPTDWPRR